MNKKEKIFALALAIVIGLLVTLPNILAMSDSRYRGLPVELNGDERSYLAYTQEALRGHFGSTGNAITRESAKEPSLHPAFVEQFTGVIFRTIGIPIEWMIILLDFLVPFLITLALFALFHALQFPTNRVIIGTALATGVQLYSLGRPVNPRSGLLLVLIALIGLARSREGSRSWPVLAGVTMGLLVGVNFWAWTAMWAIWGTLVALLLLQRSTNKGSSSYLKTAILIGLLGAIVALPFVVRMLWITGNPVYADTAFRMGPVHWRMPESWVWSGLLALTAVGTILLWKQRKLCEEDTMIVAMIVASAVILNQQLVHGILFMFRSHYAGVIMVTVVSALLYCDRHTSAYKKPILNCSIGMFSILLLALMIFDNRFVINQWQRNDSDFAQQHLADAIATIKNLPPSVILSDPDTSTLITAFTQQDTIYTQYLQISMVTNAEIAERVCLTMLPLPPNQRHLEDQNILVFGNVIPSEKDPARKAKLREEELAFVQQTCERMDREKHIDTFKHFGVNYVLWNERAMPLWDLGHLGVPFQQIEKGDGWSLWEIRDAGKTISSL